MKKSPYDSGIEVKELNRMSKGQVFDILENVEQIPPIAFFKAYTIMNDLQSLRLVQKLARPISSQQKELLIDQANILIQQLKAEMAYIMRLSVEFRGKDYAIVDGQEVIASEWKHNILKLRNSISNFYNVSLRYFQKVRDAFNLNRQIEKIDEIYWTKDTIIKMKPFCFCG